MAGRAKKADFHPIPVLLEMSVLRLAAVAGLLEALDFAAQRHSAQRRQGPDAAPYVNHLIEVATLLANVGRVDDVEVLIAAVLHDVLEDTPTTPSEVEAAFGSRVLSLVEALSDDPTLPRERRHELALLLLPGRSAFAKVIKLADLTSNIRVLPQSWERARQREYLDWSERAAALCAAESPALAQVYFERAARTRAAFDAAAG